MVTSIHPRRKVLKSKKVISRYLITICDKKERPQKCLFRGSWSRSLNLDLRLRGAGAKRNIYGSASMPSRNCSGTAWFLNFLLFGNVFVKNLCNKILFQDRNAHQDPYAPYTDEIMKVFKSA
jgi:hypothetical protein